MKNIKSKIKKTGIILGLTALSMLPLKAQEKRARVKTSLAYTTANVKELSQKGFFGLESLIEIQLKERSFFEIESGWYTEFDKYDKMQLNGGIKYLPIKKEDWNIAIKTAIGTSNEFYMRLNEFGIWEPYGENTLNLLLGLEIEKRIKNRKTSFIISRDFNKDTWRMAIRYPLKVKEERENNPILF